MATAILAGLAFLLLTVGLMLHGVYLESKIDLPCGPSNKRKSTSDSVRRQERAAENRHEYLKLKS
jgi:hypothetical protein